MSASEATQVVERFVRDVNAAEAAVKVRRPDFWERKSYTGSGDWMQVSTRSRAVDLKLNSALLTLQGPTRARIVDDQLILSGYTRAVWWREHRSELPPETFYDGDFVLMLAAGKSSEPSHKHVAFRILIGVLAALVLLGLIVMPFGLLSAVEDAQRRSESATGGVTRAESAYTGKGGTGWVCAYEFTVNGSEFGGEEQCPGGTGVGDAAPVLYEPGNPANNRAWRTAESERNNSTWGFGVWAFMLAATLWFGWVYARSRRKAR